MNLTRLSEEQIRTVQKRIHWKLLHDLYNKRLERIYDRLNNALDIVRIRSIKI